MSTVPTTASEVDAVLAIYVHDPTASRSEVPSGGQIAGIAHAALVGHDPSLAVSDNCYFRAVSPKDSQPVGDQVSQALMDGPILMDGVLGQLGLDAKEYEDELWTEQLSPGASVVWVAALRSN